MSNHNTDYHPIDCTFYDRLEEAATLKKEVDILFWNKGKLIEVTAIINDILNRNNVESLLLDNNLRIRLDHIHSLNGIELQKTC